MRYLLVNETGEILAELESLEQLVDQPGLRSGSGVRADVSSSCGSRSIPAAS